MQIGTLLVNYPTFSPIFRENFTKTIDRARN